MTPANFLNMPRVLDAATGGEFKWDTATEMRCRRARQKAKSKSKDATARPDGAPILDELGAAGVFDQAIDFSRTNLNIAWQSP